MLIIPKKAIFVTTGDLRYEFIGKTGFKHFCKSPIIVIVYK